MRYVIAGIAGGFATLLSGTIIAIMMQPLLAPYFGELIRKENEDGLLFSSLIAGYLVIGLSLSYFAPRLGVINMRLSQIFTLGMVSGLAIFLGDHLVTAGWSRLNPIAMTLSGLSDSLSVAVGFWVVTLVHRYKTNG
jgi:hypothetical protein